MSYRLTLDVPVGDINVEGSIGYLIAQYKSILNAFSSQIHNESHLLMTFPSLILIFLSSFPAAYLSI